MSENDLDHWKKEEEEEEENDLGGKCNSPYPPVLCISLL